MSSSMDERLNWLAVQYVLGELSAAECEAFELRLAADAVACEAVVSASRLVLTARAALAQAVSVAAPEPTGRTAKMVSTAPRDSWIAFAGAITAASLLLGVCTLQILRPARSASNSAAELVSLWRTGTPLVDTPSDDADTELADAVSDSGVPNTSSHDHAEAETGSNSLKSADRAAMVAALDDVPDWMLAAISIESDRAFGNASDKPQEN